MPRNSTAVDATWPATGTATAAGTVTAAGTTWTVDCPASTDSAPAADPTRVAGTSGSSASGTAVAGKSAAGTAATSFLRSPAAEPVTAGRSLWRVSISWLRTRWLRNRRPRKLPWPRSSRQCPWGSRSSQQCPWRSRSIRPCPWRSRSSRQCLWRSTIGYGTRYQRKLLWPRSIRPCHWRSRSSIGYSPRRDRFRCHAERIGGAHPQPGSKLGPLCLPSEASGGCSF